MKKALLFLALLLVCPPTQADILPRPSYQLAIDVVGDFTPEELSHYRMLPLVGLGPAFNQLRLEGCADPACAKIIGQIDSPSSIYQGTTREIQGGARQVVRTAFRNVPTYRGEGSLPWFESSVLVRLVLTRPSHQGGATFSSDVFRFEGGLGFAEQVFTVRIDPQSGRLLVKKGPEGLYPWKFE